MKNIIALLFFLIPAIVLADDEKSPSAEKLKTALRDAATAAAEDGKSVFLVVVYASDVPVQSDSKNINTNYKIWYDKIYSAPAFRQEMKEALLVRLVGFPASALPNDGEKKSKFTVTEIPAFFAGKAGTDTVRRINPEYLDGDVARFANSVIRQLNSEQ